MLLDKMHCLNYGLCECSTHDKPLSVWYFTKRLIEELIEWMRTPCIDEWSDVMLMCSQLLLSATHSLYIFPYAERSLAKGLARAEQYGCVRSLRNKCTHTVLEAFFGMSNARR